MANSYYLGSALLLPLWTSSALVLAVLVEVTAVGLNGVNPLGEERDVGICRLVAVNFGIKNAFDFGTRKNGCIL